MTIISVAITTKSGRPLLARQFVEISRLRIEGLLAAFPKLMSTDREHTFIETESVRYVYTPIESLYLFMITNKSSNIMEDIDTLGFISKLIPEYAGAYEEAAIKQNIFDLVFAIDEVIALGNKEKVNLQQVRSYLEMDSQQERLAELHEEARQREAQNIANERIKAIDAQKKAGILPTGMGSHSSASYNPNSAYGSSHSSDSYTSRPSISTPTPSESKKTQNTDTGPKKGISLTKGSGKAQSILKMMEESGELDEVVSSKPSSSKTGSPSSSAPAIAQRLPVHIVVQEGISMKFDHDGGLESLSLKGTMTLEVKDAASGLVMVKVNNQPSLPVTFNTHPNINKTAFNKNGILASREISRPFPENVALPVLKWRSQTTDESAIPFTVNCWPTPASDVLTVTLDYELTKPELVLHDVDIIIPIPGGNPPVVQDSTGTYKYDQRAHELHWTFDLIDESSSTGNLEFTIPKTNSTGLFPVRVNFKSTKTLSGIEALDAAHVETKTPVGFSQDISFSSEEYVIV